MSKLIEGLNAIYTGKNACSKMVTLFSIIGICALLTALITLQQQGLVTLNLYTKIGIIVFTLIFDFYILGYETYFLHNCSNKSEEKMPEIDFKPFKIMFNPVLIFLFIANLPITLISLLSEKHAWTNFSIALIIAIPFTMLQAGFAKDFNIKDTFEYFKKFRPKEYFLALIKLIWLTFLSYIIVFTLTIVIGAIGTIIFALIIKDANTVAVMLTSNFIIITKLVTFIVNILLMYLLTMSTFIWEYDLVAMKLKIDEKNQEF